jgi:beta-glucanase (GH16 family)
MMNHRRDINRAVPILLYHSIAEDVPAKFAEWAVPPPMFAAHMAFLSEHRYTPITVSQFAAAVTNGGGHLPDRPVVLTFDDGFVDFSTHALPILKKYGFAATLYIATGLVGVPNHRLYAESRRPILDWDQIADISASGIECGAHSHSHPQLDTLSIDSARREIVLSKELLESRLNRPVTTFAYPHGYHSSAVRRLVQEAGYSSACAVKHAMSGTADDPFALARIIIRPDRDVDGFGSLLKGRGVSAAPRREKVRTKMWRQFRRLSATVKRQTDGAGFAKVGSAVLLSVMFSLFAVGGQLLSCRAEPQDTVVAEQKGKLIFSDDFDGPSLNEDKWSTCYWWGNGGCTIASNDELEWYQPDNMLIEDGILKLRAKEEKIQADNGNGGPTVYDYTSGVITTGRSSSNTSAPAGLLFQYGYAEIRARIPKGKGLWPAFWLLPGDHISKPEIDVMEIYGDETHILRMNFHFINSDGEVDRRQKHWEGPDFSSDFHTFAVDWRPDAIIWYADGIERWRYTNEAHIPSEPMYLLINLAVGGAGPGSPDSSTPFPIDYEIDYVKVWSRYPQANTASTKLEPDPKRALSR